MMTQPHIFKLIQSLVLEFYDEYPLVVLVLVPQDREREPFGLGNLLQFANGIKVDDHQIDRAFPFDDIQ